MQDSTRKRENKKGGVKKRNVHPRTTLLLAFGFPTEQNGGGENEKKKTKKTEEKAKTEKTEIREWKLENWDNENARGCVGCGMWNVRCGEKKRFCPRDM